MIQSVRIITLVMEQKNASAVNVRRALLLIAATVIRVPPIAVTRRVAFILRFLIAVAVPTPNAAMEISVME